MNKASVVAAVVVLAHANIALAWLGSEDEDDLTRQYWENYCIEAGETAEQMGETYAETASDADIIATLPVEDQYVLMAESMYGLTYALVLTGDLGNAEHSAALAITYIDSYVAATGDTTSFGAMLDDLQSLAVYGGAGMHLSYVGSVGAPFVMPGQVSYYDAYGNEYAIPYQELQTIMENALRGIPLPGDPDFDWGSPTPQPGDGAP